MTIVGNGVTLTWAPQGPGWNWRQPEGWNPSWDRLARYGMPPVGLGDKGGPQGQHATLDDMQRTGLCAYLSEDGATLMPEPQYIWRMPSTDELVRSLVRDGQHAGCTWDGQAKKATCRVRPDKETPLWDPAAAIYYWAGDQENQEDAWYVSYNGWARSQQKSWGNPRHGHRCVRDPE